MNSTDEKLDELSTQLRQHVRKTFNFLTAMRFSDIHKGISTNIDYEIEDHLTKMYSQNKLLRIESSQGFLYPAEQINENTGLLYPQLEEIISQAKNIGLNDYEILYWLGTSKTLTNNSKVGSPLDIDYNLDAQDFDDALIEALEKQDDDFTFKISPLYALQTYQVDLFIILSRAWLSSDLD